MNDIQKYRIASAEMLGKKLKEFIWKDKKYLIPEDSDPIINDEILFWHPDIDANQREMIEDHLTNVLELELTQWCHWQWEGKSYKGEWIKTYSCFIEDRTGGSPVGYAKKQDSKSTAFRKAFMQYYEKVKNK